MPDWDAMARRGREDPFFFAYNILGYDKLEPFHAEWLKWATDFSSLRKIALEPRGSFKSTLFTITLPLFYIIQKDPVIRGITGNNLRMLIAHSVEARARDFLREIDAHLRRNPIFIQCYGELADDTTEGKWTETQKTIRTRTQHRKEPTFQAIGKSGELTSAHYDMVFIDDIVTKKDRDSQAEREDTKNFCRDLVSLVHTDGLVFFTGTHWHFEDQYKYVIEELNRELEDIGETTYQIRSNSVFMDDDITPRYPALLGTREIEKLKVEKGTHDFWAQYGNKPVPPQSQIFNENDFQYYDIEELPPRYRLRVYGYCDPSLGKSLKGCPSVIVTVAQDKVENTLWLVHADVKVRSTEDLKQDIVEAFKRYDYDTFGFEIVGFQDETRKDAEKMLARQYKPVAFRQIDNRGDKMARIQGAEGRIKAVKLRVDWNRAYREAMDQLFHFPSTYMDFPDAFEGVLQLVQTASLFANEIVEINTIEAIYQGPAALVAAAEF